MKGSSSGKGRRRDYVDPDQTTSDAGQTAAERDDADQATSDAGQTAAERDDAGQTAAERDDADQTTSDADQTTADADQTTSDADQTTADADQTTADADQTTSDADQTAAERDDADAASDQRAADRDQATADHRLEGGGDGAAPAVYEASRHDRETSSIRRLATHIARSITTRSRADTATRRDANAARRDATARRRDEEAEEFSLSLAASHESIRQRLAEISSRAAADRAQAAADRLKAAEDRAAAARERERLKAELDSAHLDDLTGAFRRETGTLALRHEIDRARRADGRFIIAFVDIDGMKSVNDRNGHAAGDHVLRALVWTLRSNLRSFDPVVRYGGDEFVCGIGGVDIGEVERRFEAINRVLKDEIGVGISVGLAGLEPDDTLERITGRADAALLDAKKRRGD